MNYWILTTEYPPLHGGGISTYCHFTGNMLSSMGYQVKIFVADACVSQVDVEEKSASLTVIRFNPNRNHLQDTLGYNARLSYAFADVVKLFIARDGKPDCIESQEYLGIAYYLTQFKCLGYPWLNNVVLVITLHSPAFLYLECNRVPVYRFPDFWTCEMEKNVIIAADLLIAPTSFIVEAIGRYIDLATKKISIIPNPYKSDEEVLPGFDANRRIVFYGKLSPQKGIFELLEYFKELWDAKFSHPLDLIGGTDIVYYPELKTMGQLVKERYDNYIKKGLLILSGKIKPDEIQSRLQEAYVVLIPSLVDNLPYAAMEAMSLGKIVLASTQGGQREMIEDGVTGFLFDHNEHLSFQNKLLNILMLSEEEAGIIGMNAIKKIKSDYSFERIGKLKNELVLHAKRSSVQADTFPFLSQNAMIPYLEIVVQKGLLSVVVPYHNMAAYIFECVESVVKSTWKNIEIIVVDDGSDEAESAGALATLSTMECVRIIRHENKGLAETRNSGAHAARGEYLAFLDADDFVDPSYYTKAIAVMEENRNVFFVGSWVQYFGESNKVWITFTPQPPYILAHNTVNSSSLVYRRQAFISGGLNDKKVDYGLEDYESIINMLRHGFNGVVLPEILFHYRVRSGSMFRRINQNKLLYATKYIAEKHADYFSNYAVQVINLLNANGPGYLFDNPTFEIKVTSTNTRESLFMHNLKSIVRKNAYLKKIALTLKILW